MAKFGRYDKGSVNTFDPLTLNEVMMVPLAKQRMHDDTLDNAQKELESLYSQQSLEPHNDLLQQRVQELEGGINDLTTGITKEGIDQNRLQQFRGLKQNFTKELSPQGQIGQINAAKEAFDVARAETISQGSKHHTPQRAAELWDEQYGRYKDEFAETGKVRNIEAYQTLAREDYEKDILNFNKVLGHYKTANNIGSGVSFKQDPSGQIYAVDNSGKRVILDNIQNLQGELDYLSAKYLDPEGTGYKYNVEANIDQDNVSKSIKGMLDAQRIRENFNVTENRITKGGKGSAGGDIAGGRSSTSSVKTNALATSYSDLKSQRNKINNKQIVNNRDIQQYRDLEYIESKGERELLKDPKYIGLSTQLTELNEILDVPGEDHDKYLTALEGGRKPYQFTTNDDGSKQLNSVTGYGGRNNKPEYTPIGSPLSEDEYNLLKNNKSLKNQLEKSKDDFMDDYISRNGIERTKVTVGYDKTSEKSLRALSSLQSVSSDSFKVDDISYIGLDGERQSKELTNDHSEELLNIFKLTSPGNIDEIAIGKQGNEVGYIVNFKPPKDSGVDTNVIWGDLDFDGNTQVEMFIPLNRTIDPITGRPDTSANMLNILEPSDARNARAMIETKELSSTPNEDSIGYNATANLTDYFTIQNNYLKGSKLDFKKNLDNNSVTPYFIDRDGSKGSLSWNEVIDFDKLDKSDAYATEMDRSSVLDIMFDAAKYYKDDNNKLISEKYNIDYDSEGRLNDQADINGYIKFLQNQDITLKEVSDAYYFSKLK